MVDISIILPVCNEEGSLESLYDELTDVLVNSLKNRTYEMVWIDDGSTDRSYEELMDLAVRDEEHVRVIRFRNNFGQSATLAAGIAHATGQFLITMDADGQNDPYDIPILLQTLEEGDYDVVNGWRYQRQRSTLHTLFSWAGNALIRAITRLDLHDRGCSMRALRRSAVAKDLPIYGEMHRYVTELARQRGARVTEVPIHDRTRRHGKSKYGAAKWIRILLDLITVEFLDRYRFRPMHLFGYVGVVCMIVAGVVLLLLFLGLLLGCGAFSTRATTRRQETRGSGVSISQKMSNVFCCLLVPLLLLIAFGVQCVFFGLLGELLVRTTHELDEKPIYVIRDVYPPPTTTNTTTMTTI